MCEKLLLYKDGVWVAGKRISSDLLPHWQLPGERYVQWRRIKHWKKSSVGIKRYIGKET